LRFAARNGLLRPGALGVNGANIGHHADLRQGEVAQEGDLAGDVESHFEHGTLVARAKAEYRER
jgi:hypothetical protein